jgi:hypothetical protein
MKSKNNAKFDSHLLLAPVIAVAVIVAGFMIFSRPGAVTNALPDLSGIQPPGAPDFTPTTQPAAAASTGTGGTTPPAPVSGGSGSTQITDFAVDDTAPSQGSTITFTGVLKDANGRPIEGGFVEVVSSLGVMASGATDSSGRFSLTYVVASQSFTAGARFQGSASYSAAVSTNQVTVTPS